MFISSALFQAGVNCSGCSARNICVKKSNEGVDVPGQGCITALLLVPWKSGGLPLTIKVEKRFGETSLLDGGSMEYRSLDRVPPDKVVGTTAHAVGELELSTHCGFSTSWTAAVPFEHYFYEGGRSLREINVPETPTTVKHNQPTIMPTSP